MMSLPRCLQTTLACVAVLLASGCATKNTPTYVKSLQGLWGADQASSLPEQPNPAYRYLRIQANDSPPALLVLGYEDPHPQGLVEVWYSAKQEVIKIQNGRIIGTAGLPINWDRVHTPDLSDNWPAVPASGSGYQRQRDVSPGYRANVTDHITVQPHTGLPPIALPASLPAATAARLQWFSEDAQNSAAPLPTAWFAWGQHRGQASIVYSRQCLSPQYCLQLQRWPQEPAQ